MTDRSSLAPSVEWQLLGERAVPARLSEDDLISTWLLELLAPLCLHANFLNKISKSAHDCVGRALRQNGVTGFGHIHIAIFAPVERTSKEHTWGFFRIEKIDSMGQSQPHPDHTVEFYLYQER